VYAVDTTNSQFRLARGQFQEETPRFSPRRLGTIIFSVVVTAMLVYGWDTRDDSFLSAADGWGYKLGIIGGSLMTLLLFYPLRKRLRFMQSWGSIKHWFRIHMLFGVIGPVLILFHSNFHLGSTNSNVALICMLLVAGSGLIGRFLYTRIHFGLYGHRATLEELRKDLQVTRSNLGAHTKLSPRIIEYMKSYERLMLKRRMYLLHLLLMPLIYVRSRILLYQIKHTSNASCASWPERTSGTDVHCTSSSMRPCTCCGSISSAYARPASLVCTRSFSRSGMSCICPCSS